MPWGLLELIHSSGSLPEHAQLPCACLLLFLLGNGQLTASRPPLCINVSKHLGANLLMSSNGPRNTVTRGWTMLIPSPSWRWVSLSVHELPVWETPRPTETSLSEWNSSMRLIGLRRTGRRTKSLLMRIVQFTSGTNRRNGLIMYRYNNI